MLSDLGEQVSKLRGALGEAQAREQAARTEAEGLAAERGDLVSRAEVGGLCCGVVGCGVAGS